MYDAAGIVWIEKREFPGLKHWNSLLVKVSFISERLMRAYIAVLFITYILPYFLSDFPSSIGRKIFSKLLKLFEYLSPLPRTTEIYTVLATVVCNMFSKLKIFYSCMREIPFRIYRVY